MTIYTPPRFLSRFRMRLHIQLYSRSGQDTLPVDDDTNFFSQDFYGSIEDWAIVKEPFGFGFCDTRLGVREHGTQRSNAAFDHHPCVVETMCTALRRTWLTIGHNPKE